MPEDPVDPISPLAEGAAAAHELYRSYVDAGFSQAEALWLTAVVVTASLPGGGLPPPP